MKDKFSIFIVFVISTLIVFGVYLNVKEEQSIDRSKIPQKVEEFQAFQRWITNLRNNDIVVEADHFKLDEEVEIYNTKWITISSIEENGKREEYEKTINEHKNLDMVVFSPSERLFIDSRNIPRNGYNSNEVRFYGLTDDKIIDAKIVDCSIRANCYFDRAYFLDNDVFVVTEISRNMSKKDETTPLCSSKETCTYTYKLHVIDLVNNSRLLYESQPFDTILDELIPEL